MDFTITQNVDLPEKPRPIVSIGAGGIVKDSHYPAYKKAGFPVAGLYDLNPARAAEMAELFGVPVIYESLADAVSNAPPDAIFDVALPASAILGVLPHIPDGRSVLIQKPMGNNLDEARQIRDICHARHLTAAINFQLRTAPVINAARSLIDQGAIGEITDMEVRVTVYTPWHLWSFLYGIPRVEILYHSIHYLDLIRAFLGDPQSVYAKTLQHPAQRDIASSRTTVILDYGAAIRANVETNHNHGFGRKHQDSYVKIEGTGGAIYGVIGVNLNYPVGEPDSLEYCTLENGRPSAWTTVPISGSWFPDAFIGPMAAIMRFTEGSSNVLPTSVDDAFKTMAVVEAAYQSSSAGGTPIPS
jgi:predicted dehydrogenase